MRGGGGIDNQKKQFERKKKGDMNAHAALWQY